MICAGDRVQLNPEDRAGWSWVFEGDLSWDDLYTVKQVLLVETEAGGRTSLTNVSLAEKPGKTFDIEWFVRAQPILF